MKIGRYIIPQVRCARCGRYMKLEGEDTTYRYYRCSKCGAEEWRLQDD